MKKTICLNMIVKNESKVIQRCLNSVKQFIDHWVIVDTGSTDGTQEIIRETMKEMPGELHERPWVDFGHNRNEAFSYAKDKADYLLFIDADERWDPAAEFKMPDLTRDQYFISTQQPDGMTYFRVGLVKTSLPWKWIGVAHEEILCPQAQKPEILPNLVNRSNAGDGHSWQSPDKYLKDAKLLEKGLKDEPNNSRYVFYLALSYGKAKEYELAIKNFQKRVSMGGLEEEVFYSLLNIARIQEGLNKPVETFVESYTKAYFYRPSRAEPLYFLANYYINAGNPFLGYIYSKLGLEIPYPKDLLFVLHDVYDTGLALQFLDTSYAIGRYDECLTVSEKLMKNPRIPSERREQIRANMVHLKTKMKQK
ncbi:MAG: glycosyltransferase [Verrucomicrobia bacterium]|nr:glycosyltransferase [Verrucomicrobiota bacterium]